MACNIRGILRYGRGMPEMQAWTISPITVPSQTTGGTKNTEKLSSDPRPSHTRPLAQA